MAQRLLAPPPPSPSPLRVCGVPSSPFPLLLSRLRFPLSLLFPLPSLSPLSLPFLLSLSSPLALISLSVQVGHTHPYLYSYSIQLAQTRASSPSAHQHPLGTRLTCYTAFVVSLLSAWH